MPILSKRSFLTGLVSLVAAPAIVRADSLMAIRGVSLYPKLFMTVTLDGLATIQMIGYASSSPVTITLPSPRQIAESLDVPWLGSVADSMAWYNKKLTEIQPKFSRVNSITWKEHMPVKYSWKPPEGISFSTALLRDSRTVNGVHLIPEEWKT